MTNEEIDVLEAKLRLMREANNKKALADIGSYMAENPLTKQNESVPISAALKAAAAAEQTAKAADLKTSLESINSK